MPGITEGPWHVYIGGNFVHVVAEGFEEWTNKNKYLGGPLTVAHVEYAATEDSSPDRHKAIANGFMLAAAPKLLKACKAWMLFVAHCQERNVVVPLWAYELQQQADRMTREAVEEAEVGNGLTTAE